MGSGQLSIIAVPGIPLVNAGDDLESLIQTALQTSGLALQDGDILVVAQKIVSKAEDRSINLNDVTVSAEARELAAATDKEPISTKLRNERERTIIRSITIC